MDKKEITSFDKAQVIAEVLPYMQRFSGETFVIKFGGSFISTDPEAVRNLAENVVLLKQIGINPIIVHGGGDKISSILRKLGIECEFIDGLRMTSQAAMEVVEMVLSGSVNKHIVSMINLSGGSAVGISGRDSNMIKAKKIKKLRKSPFSNVEEIVEMGFVGDPYIVEQEFLMFLEDSAFIPVVASVCSFDDGSACNVNADSVAGVIASAMSASKLIVLTNVDGIFNSEGEIIKSISTKEAESLIDKNTITAGMIPKIRTCCNFVSSGCGVAHVINGSVPNSLLLELFTESGTGTMITD